MVNGPGRLAGAILHAPEKMGFVCRNIKTVEFTKEKGLTGFMSTEKCGKILRTTLHGDVEVSVEVVETLKTKGLP